MSDKIEDLDDETITRIVNEFPELYKDNWTIQCLLGRERTCATCVHWRCLDVFWDGKRLCTAEWDGHCWRYPPQYTNAVGDKYTCDDQNWACPITTFTDRCGEYKERV